MLIGLLGAVEAMRDGASVPLGGLRVRGLLARLALDAGHPVALPTLVDDLWGDAPPGSAANALQALVSRLRRAVGADLVATAAGGYRFAVPPDAVDAARFGELVAAGTGAGDPHAGHALLGQALGLWRGPALADVRELPFAEPAAHRLAERRAVAVDERARLALLIGEPAAEIDALTAQLDATPLRETTAAVLARVLHAANRQADALAVLDRTRRRLAEELGVDPGAELEDARLAVLRGASTPARRPVRSPVPALTSFVGRERDVVRVRDLLATVRLVTLIGPGGAGKTRLAREAVASRAAGRADEYRVAELAALTDAHQLPAAVLAAAGEPELVVRSAEAPEPDTTARLVAALTGRRIVLVLDNCEHLVDAVAALAESLLHACTGLRVLATSREPLGIVGEVLHPVDALTTTDAMRLFADRAAAVCPGFALTPDVAPAVAEICRRLDGQPLPIELAAARLRTLSAAEIASRLDDRFRLLTSGARTALPRHQTLRAVVDWSWDLLSEPERAVARRLAAFAGGATADAAERVCAGRPVAGDVFGLLASLVDKSIVVAVRQPDGAPTRYRMLETIREYAGERLDEAGERAVAEAAHLAVLFELVEAAEPHLRGADQLPWLTRLRAEAEELDIALRRVVAAADAASGHRLVAGLAWSWIIRGLFEDLTRWLGALLPMDGPAPASVRALNWAYEALQSAIRGDGSGELDAVTAAVASADELPRPLHPTLQLTWPIHTLFVDSDDGPIRRLAAEAEDPWVRGFAFNTLALAAENDGELDEQRQLLRAAHEAFRLIGDRFGLGMVVHSLGELEDIAGEYEAAASAYDESIALAADLGNTDDLPLFESNRAMLEARRGDLGSARARIRDALDLHAPRLGNDGALLISLSHIERMAGDLDRARHHLEAAAATDGTDRPHRRTSLCIASAAIEVAAGDLAAARACVTEAVAASVETRDGPVIARVAEVAATLALAEGDPAGASRLLGIAAAQRGAVDLGSPEVLASYDHVRAALGRAADEEVRRGLEMARDEGRAALVAYAGEQAAQVRRW
ncbi:AAA family ATPase [Pseudonocardia sp. DSM 110487]|uniref:BTAD domain-containing putative transcriptional regulator n=1 Tax=Pseudonocardia sp. DSM 110487 TaxID=2865833 RepID=UPI001C6A26DD|nr:BTAD domain-containing putative transcriptional regulator [Pseudonocardia sp. DSM 110487]QYN38632.1 AAA family ATPase [Pseudonocardia sp. DSM 110487]